MLWIHRVVKCVTPGFRSSHYDMRLPANIPFFFFQFECFESYSSPYPNYNFSPSVLSATDVQCMFVAPKCHVTFNGVLEEE